MKDNAYKLCYEDIKKQISIKSQVQKCFLTETPPDWRPSDNVFRAGNRQVSAFLSLRNKKKSIFPNKFHFSTYSYLVNLYYNYTFAEKQ
jgi:hypothetical protein